MIILILAILIAIIFSLKVHRILVGIIFYIKAHRHHYYKPIVSRYISFNTRDIVYECKCGKRKIIREYRPFDVAFPIETTNHITHQELEKIANNKKL